MRSVLLIALVLVVSLAAAVIASGTGKAPNVASSNSEQAASERSRQSMRINIRIANKLVTATLVDNPTARDFISLLPLNLSMDDLFGREKFGHLPKTLSEKGSRTHSYQVGDIAYWSPAHDLAIYYRQDGESIPSPGIIPIGKIDAGTEAFNVPGLVKVTIEVSK
jgi:hypothetical protein